MTATTETLERVPPQSADCAAALLGSMFRSDEAAGIACDRVAPEDFSRPDHQLIFTVAADLEARSKPVNLVSTANELGSRLNEIGDRDCTGAEYLALLAEAVPSALSVEYYCDQVRKCSQQRQLIRIGDELALDAGAGQDPAELVERAEGDLYGVMRGRQAGDAQHIGIAVASVAERLAAGEAPGLSTGFPGLDRVTGGIRPGSFWVLAARTSIGKTSFGLGVTRSFVTHGRRVLFVSYEGGDVDVAERALALETSIPLQAVRRSVDLTGAQLARLTLAGTVIERWPLTMVNAAARRLGPVQVRRQVRRAKARHPDLALVVIDYLQLVGEPPDMRRNANREQAVALTSAMLAATAREFDVAILCLSQLNRQAEGRRDHQPELADLRESGAIEQDADVVMLLHRPGFYRDGPDYGDAYQRAQLIVAKHRSGPTGVIDLTFVPRLARFLTPGREYEAAEDPAAREPAAVGGAR